MGRLRSVAVTVALPLAVAAYSVELTATRIPGGPVQVEYRLPEGMASAQAVLYRSYLDLTRMGSLDAYANPISSFDLGRVAARGRWTDSMLADGVTYWYYLKVKSADGGMIPGLAAKVEIPPQALQSGACDQGCFLLVDKVHYLLEVRRGREILKRYPISLGGNPVDRKLHQDNRTTPEGSYRIDYLKPQSQFHKAYGIDYPNAEDRARYDRARRGGTLPREDDGEPGIGGAVQIHGGGVGNNWTWGCMAMENGDIDELFSQKGIKAGTQVLIAGKEMKRADLERALRPAGADRSSAVPEVEGTTTEAPAP